MRAGEFIFERQDTQPKVYLDMDGVLADFIAGYNKRFGTNYAGNEELPDAKVDQNFPKLVGTDFFQTLPMFGSAPQLVRAVVDLFGYYNISSSPLRGDHENSGNNKRAWLVSHLSPNPRQIEITSRKEKNAVQANGTPNVLVDDKPRNIQRWQDRGGIGILYNAAVDDVDDVIAKLKAIADKYHVNENFADGKKPGRRGLAKRMGVNCKQSVSKLRKIAKNSSGERQRMAHWCANMKAGRKK